MASIVDAYGLEHVSEALARVCERDAGRSRGLPRERVLRRMARLLRALGANAREYLNEGLAATKKLAIGRRTALVPEMLPLRAQSRRVAFVVVTAIRKSGIRKIRASRLTTDEAVCTAGGVTQYDLVEFEAYGRDAARLFADALPSTALACFAHLRTG